MQCPKTYFVRVLVLSEILLQVKAIMDGTFTPLHTYVFSIIKENGVILLDCHVYNKQVLIKHLTST